MIPCTDVCKINSCLEDDKIHIEQSSTSDNHCDDMCSPLCVCFCCNDVTTVCSNFVFEHYNIQSTYNQSESQNFSLHFLESDSPPPKS